MCRHLAYLGPQVPIGSIVLDPPYGLLTQSWQPRRQRHGVLNGDGYGIGWYADGDPLPARYRRAGPMWADESLRDVARVTRTGALLAAVRSASLGTTPDASAAAPFRADRWLFSHNGRIDGWPDSTVPLAGTLPTAALLQIEARVDSALLWALVLHRLRGGAPPGQALATTVADAAAVAAGRYNLLLTDGRTIAATACGDTLAYRTGPGSVLVASEESDAEPGWVDVPDRSLLVATAAEVTVTPLPVNPSHPARSDLNPCCPR